MIECKCKSCRLKAQHTSQTRCTSCPSGAAWRKRSRIGTHWCLDRCSPWRPHHGCYAAGRIKVNHYPGTVPNQPLDINILNSVSFHTFRCSLNSSSNLRPHILVPPFPVPVRNQILVSQQTLQIEK